MSPASRPARWMTSCPPWAVPASPRAMSAGSARKLMSGSTPFRRGRSRAHGPPSGSTPPVRRSARAALAIGLEPVAPRWLTVGVAVTRAVGVDTDGRREVLGRAIGAWEAEPFRVEFPRGLVRRGLAGVKLVSGDAHDGIEAATARVPSTTWQRRRVRFQRNAPAHAGENSRRVVSAFIATAYRPARPRGRQGPGAPGRRPGARHPKLATLLDAAEEDVRAYRAFPQRRRAKPHATDPVERLNGEIKRRAGVGGIFPNEASIGRLVGARQGPRTGGGSMAHPHGADRGMDRPTRSLSHAGNARAGPRGSHSRPARRATRLTGSARQ